MLIWCLETNVHIFYFYFFYWTLFQNCIKITFYLFSLIFYFPDIISIQMIWTKKQFSWPTTIIERIHLFSHFWCQISHVYNYLGTLHEIIIVIYVQNFQTSLVSPCCRDNLVGGVKTLQSNAWYSFGGTKPYSRHEFPDEKYIIGHYDYIGSSSALSFAVEIQKNLNNWENCFSIFLLF